MAEFVCCAFKVQARLRGAVKEILNEVVAPTEGCLDYRIYIAPETGSLSRSRSAQPRGPRGAWNREAFGKVSEYIDGTPYHSRESSDLRFVPRLIKPGQRLGLSSFDGSLARGDELRGWLGSRHSYSQRLSVELCHRTRNSYTTAPRR